MFVDKKISVVIPCYKSSKTIGIVVNDAIAEFERLSIKLFEFVLVNDGSPDNGATSKVLKSLSDKFGFVKVIELSKNFGQHNAIMAGLNYVSGDYVVGMDDDGQTHPSQFEKLFCKIEEGYDIVYGYYPEKKHNKIRNLFSYLNYLSVRTLIRKPKELKSSSFWIADRFVIEEVVKYKGCYAYLQGLFLRTTKNITSVPIQHFERKVGSSGYTFKSLLRLWSSIIGFSVIPLRMASYLGYLSSFVGFVGGIVVLIKKIVNPYVSIGWPSIMVAIFIFSGLMLMFLGLVGEYIGRMYLAQNAEPQYVIKIIYGEDKTL